MERSISFSLYAAAFLLSVAIFVTGVLVGQAVDRSSTESISEEVVKVSQKVSSVQLLLLMEKNTSAMCPVYLDELTSISDDVERMGYKLTYLEEEKHIYDNELKKQYFVLEAESHVLSEKVKTLCGDRSILLINFYSNRNCTRCAEEGGDILEARDALTAQGTPVKLFSFDGELGSPVAEVFEARYNVTTYPTIVINGKTYPGFRSSEELQTLMRNSS